jgi:hypothetical protein
MTRGSLRPAFTLRDLCPRRLKTDPVSPRPNLTLVQGLLALIGREEEGVLSVEDWAEIRRLTLRQV